MVALPGGRGLFEIKTEGDADSRGARKKEHKLQIVVFFYDSDGSTPMSPAPSDVKVKMGSAEGSTVALTPRAAARETTTNRFASDPGPYREGFDGELQASIGGEAVKAPFMFR